MRGVDLPCTSAHRPWEGWGAATHARPAPRAQVRKCASAQGGAGWRKRRRPFQGWKVLVKLGFWALKPRWPAPTPDNVGPPPKLGPCPLPLLMSSPYNPNHAKPSRLGPTRLSLLPSAPWRPPHRRTNPPPSRHGGASGLNLIRAQEKEPDGKSNHTQMCEPLLVNPANLRRNPIR